MTNAGDESGRFDATARIRAARARERALGDVPAVVRSPAAVRDRLLAVLATVDGIRPTGSRALAAIAVRYPRVGVPLRDAAGRALAAWDVIARRARRPGGRSAR